MPEKDHNPKITAATSRETNLSEEMVKRIWNSAIRAVVDTITSEELQTIRLPHIGKFTPNWRYINHKSIESLIPKPDDGSTESV